LVGTDADQFVLTDGNTYPINLLNGQSATVDISFAPTSAGAKTAELQVVDNTADATSTATLNGNAGALPYTDNFDALIVGQQLACQDPVNWTTWSDLPCDPVEDAYISDLYALSGANSAVFVEDNDQIKLLGDLTSGKWEISFQMYIPTGKAGYFNVQSEFVFVTGGYWAMEVYFDVGGSGSLETEQTVSTAFTWAEDTWQLVEIVVDLDSDVGEFWFDGTMVHSWQWTNGATTGTGPLMLAAVDIFGGTPNDEMYVDNFQFQQSSASTFQLSVDIEEGWNMVSIPGNYPGGNTIDNWWADRVLSAQYTISYHHTQV
jgi:hypothetical protein